MSRRALAAALLPFALAACTGSLFQSKALPPTVYLLSAGSNAPAPSAADRPIPADLAVLKPRVRAGLDTERIAVLYPDRRLDYFADARWSGPLDEVVQDLAVQELHARANLRNVSDDASAFASAYWLEIEVTDFQAEYATAAAAPTVHVRLLGRIGNSADRQVLRRFAADAHQAAADNRLTAIVEAYEHAADEALATIAADAAAALLENSKAR